VTFDPTSFTMPHMLLEMWGSTPSARLTRGDPGEIREFIARAMIDAVPMSDLAYSALLENPGGGDAAMWTADKTARYRVYCQILTAPADQKFEPTQQNVHSFLPRCYDEKSLAALSTLYAHCFTKKDFTTSQDAYVTEGDIVRISCMFDSRGKIVLTKCDIEDIVKKTVSVDRILCSAAASIKELFE